MSQFPPNSAHYKNAQTEIWPLLGLNQHYNLPATHSSKIPAIFYPAGCITLYTDFDSPLCGTPLWWNENNQIAQSWLAKRNDINYPRLEIASLPTGRQVTISQPQLLPWEHGEKIGGQALIHANGSIDWLIHPAENSHFGLYCQVVIKALASPPNNTLPISSNELRTTSENPTVAKETVYLHRPAHNHNYYFDSWHIPFGNTTLRALLGDPICNDDGDPVINQALLFTDDFSFSTSNTYPKTLNLDFGSSFAGTVQWLTPTEVTAPTTLDLQFFARGINRGINDPLTSGKALELLKAALC